MLDELLLVLPPEVVEFVYESAPLVLLINALMNVIKPLIKNKLWHEPLTYIISILLIGAYSGFGWISLFGGIIVGGIATGFYRLIKK